MAGYLRFIKFSGYLSNQTKRKEYVPLVFLLVRPQIISRWVVLLTATFSGFGYSWNIHPLADCVKSALTFSKALLLRKRKNRSCISRPRTESATLALCVNSAPFNQPEQTGNVATTYARKLFIAREAHCERLSYILKQCAQTLANSLLLGIINLCSSFWSNTVLTRARGFTHSFFLAPSHFLARVCGESLAVNSASSLILRVTSLATVGKQSKLTIRKERDAFVFNRKVCKQVRLISNRESEQQQGSFN